MNLPKSTAFFLLGLSLLGAGCGQKLTENLAERAMENAIEKQSGGNVDLDLSGGQVAYTDKDGNKVQYGNNVSVPSDFPKEIPVYANASVLSTAMAADSSSITLQTSDKATDVLTWYESQLSEWKKEASFDMQNVMARTYDKDGKKLVLSLSTQDAQTAISIQLQNAQ